MIKIRKGLDLPLAGAPDQTIDDGPSVRRVALLGDDYVGMKPTMLVREGDAVRLGQPLFADKKNEGVQYTAPGAGVVEAINRGAKRKFESIVIRLEGSDEATFESFQAGDFSSLGRDTVRANLVASGLWTAFKTRPFSKVPAIESTPHSIFVQAIDTRPLAADPAVVLTECAADFERGIQAIAQLTDGTVHLCARPNAAVPGAGKDRVQLTEFDGPHPAGLPGTHIHKLDPVNDKKTVWSIDYQDVVAIGRLMLTGRLSVERVISLAGPGVRRPRLLRTRIGAAIDDLTAGELDGESCRVISGSVLSGRAAEGPLAFLGRFHTQISVIPEEKTRPFLGWLGPGFGSYSATPVFASALIPGRSYRLGTAAHGDPRAIIPFGAFEKVMPLDIVPSALLKSLEVGDAERSQALGCLELDEEDLELCSFVDPGKGNFGASLRRVLTLIEKEG